MITVTVRRQRRRGFTLLEALLAAVVLAAAITAVTMPMTVAVVNEHEESRQTLATGLAQELMEEILSQPFHDPQGTSEPGPEIGESSRDLFDNVDDYHGYAESAGEIVTMDGDVVDDPVGGSLSRDASATYVYVTGQPVDGSPDFIRVMVTVKYGSRSMISLTRLVYAFPEE